MYLDEEALRNWAEHGERNAPSEVTYDGNSYQPLTCYARIEVFPNSYTKNPGLDFYRLVLGHMTILEPIRFGKRMSYSDWPILGSHVLS